MSAAHAAAILVTPDAECETLLPGHDFVDAYQVRAGLSGLSARQAAEAIIKHPPGWISLLMATRNRVVSLFQLRTVEIGVGDPHGLQHTVGGFPLVAQSEREVVLGFDDHHLDFRISIKVAPDGPEATQVTVSTIVKTNNLLGRSYLATIMPFHRLIVRHLLEHARFRQQPS
ncbi:DUF2867 domain-containing protein [Collimonas sp.]|jgi:hypothetical protein|uniref:DUF2867 domain-containing protein n=1 Tax=Collimonas sp. TaxID=1963772 RepID=UPI002C4285E6|nr:DUF2867 domain-containing protein [Collimonas sp.]HWW99429.1 DUF2867 domain-containing protein [Collimonas sp.]